MRFFPQSSLLLSIALPVAIETVAETSSTNADLAARIAQDGRYSEGTWLIADRQTAGRGRQGRQWRDAPGNFMGSTAVYCAPGDPPITTLSLVAGLALYETVVVRLGNAQGLALKWPNDLLLCGAKLAGILLEREGHHAIIGIGVNLAAAPDVGDRPVTALAEKGPRPQRDAFAQDLARQLMFEIAAWRQSGFAPVRARWMAAAHPLGQMLCVHETARAQVRGAFAGICADGAMQLRLANGTIRVIRAGDVTVEDKRDASRN